MTSDYLTSDSVAGNLTGKEEVVAKVEGKEKSAQFIKKFYCTNCKKGIHNSPDNDQRCKAKGCECKCRFYYMGLDGHLRKYGIPDDSLEKLKEIKPPYSERFEKLLDEARKIMKNKRMMSNEA